MKFHVVTLFPEMFDSYLGESILARAIKQKKIKVDFVNPRKFVTGKYRKVWPDGNISLQIDERPYAGGPGMVLMAEPIVKAVVSIIKKIQKTPSTSPKGGASRASMDGARHDFAKSKIINFSPSGKKFDTAYAKKLARTAKQGGYEHIIMICGRYEGIDARAVKIIKDLTKGVADIEEVSIGDYVLTGGEIPAMVLIDSISRQVEGVLGNFDSREEERVSSSEFYTRPEVIEIKNKDGKLKKYKVPPVLLSGDHKKIEEWKKGK